MAATPDNSKNARSTSTPIVPRITVGNGSTNTAMGTARTPTSILKKSRISPAGSSRTSLDSSPEEPSPSASAATAPKRGKVKLRSVSMGPVGAPDVSPKISRFGQQLRQGVPHTLTCSMFCGGRACKYESSAAWPNESQAIRGVFSHWVTTNILAMARPNTEMVKGHDLIRQFRRNEIKSIVNLQERGEHAHCGNGLESSGFSYDPEVFMSNNVYFFNFGWKDFGTPPRRTILDMVKVMDFAVQQGKVAVHCHAGLGRTGMLIACYLIYGESMSADDSITLVRKRRPGSIQTEGQIETVQMFGDYIKPLRTVYPFCSPDYNVRLTTTEHLANEQLLLHGWSAREKRTIPKIIAQLCHQLEAGLQTPSSPAVTSSAASLQQTPERRRISLSPLAASGKHGPSCSSLPEIPSRPRTPPQSPLQGDVDVFVSTSELNLSPSMSSDPSLASPVLPVVSSKQGRQQHKHGRLSVPSAMPLRHSAGSLSHSTSNLPRLIAPESSGDLAETRPPQRAASSDVLNLLPDYERNELLALRTRRIGSAPLPSVLKSPPAMAGRSSTGSSSRPDSSSSPSERKRKTAAVTRSAKRYTANELLYIMAALQPSDRDVSGKLLALMRSVNENRLWSLLENETNPRVLWILLNQWMASLKEPVLSNSTVMQSRDGGGASEDRSQPETLDGFGEVNTVIVRRLIQMVLQIVSEAVGPGVDRAEDNVLNQLASVLSHVHPDCGIAREKACGLVEIVRDNATKRTKHLLRRLMMQAKGRS